MSKAEQRHQEEYQEYLLRAERELGSIAVGQYAKWAGQLVHKLSHEEFVERYEQYLEIRRAYDEILNQGDTVNDAVVQLLNEHAAQLLLKL